jgi:hypothetical protein
MTERPETESGEHPPIIKHPDALLPAKKRLLAYAALVAAIAAREPEALASAAASLEDEGGTGPHLGEVHPAAALARAWLEFAGPVDAVVAPAGARVYSFGYPAIVEFEVVSTAGKRATERAAAEAVAALLEIEQPLCAVQGALPQVPAILNLKVWMGTEKRTDELTIEHVEPPLK